MRFLCRIGHHDWSPWGPVKETVLRSPLVQLIHERERKAFSLSNVPTSELWERTIHRQHRVCLSCEAADIREVRP